MEFSQLIFVQPFIFNTIQASVAAFSVVAYNLTQSHTIAIEGNLRTQTIITELLTREQEHHNLYNVKITVALVIQ